MPASIQPTTTKPWKQMDRWICSRTDINNTTLTCPYTAERASSVLTYCFPTNFPTLIDHSWHPMISEPLRGYVFQTFVSFTNPVDCWKHFSECRITSDQLRLNGPWKLARNLQHRVGHPLVTRLVTILAHRKRSAWFMSTSLDPEWSWRVISKWRSSRWTILTDHMFVQ